MRLVVLCRLLCFGLLLATPPVRAGVWTSIGPDGGPLESVTIDPVTPSTVYASTGFDGVLKSVDGGVTWSSITPPGTYGFGQKVVVDPLAHSTIYVSRGSTMSKSLDGGATWTGYPTGESYPSSLAIDPIHPTNLWMGGLNVVRRSTDGGVTWTATTLPPPATSEQPFDLSVDPSNPSVVFAASSSNAGVGVYRSVDAGVTFTRVLAVPTQAVAVDPLLPTTVFCGVLGPEVYRSTNGGTSWVEITAGLQSSIGRGGIAVDPTNPLVVYAGGGGGRFQKSVDGGLTWTVYTTGLLPSDYVQGIAIDPSNPSTILGAGPRGAARSTDGGVTWIVSGTGIRSSDVKSVTVDSTDPNVLYAARYTLGIAKSTDGGATWTDTTNNVGSQYVDRVLVDPATPSTLYAQLAFSQGIAKSTDGGATWNEADSGIDDEVTNVALAPSDPTTLYASTFNGAYKSVDGGDSWSPTALSVNPTNTGLVAIDPTSADVVYVGKNTTVYRSSDGGGTWTPVDVVPAVLGGTLTMLGVDPAVPTTVYAGITNGLLPGVFVSTNGGASWARTRSAYPSDIAFRTSSPAAAFVGISGGLIMSTNQGTTWTDVGGGLPLNGAQAVAVGGSLLYAGTLDAGLWRRSTAPCAVDADCDDGNLCTIDTCNPASPQADGLGCVRAPVTCSPSECHGAQCQPLTGQCLEYQKADNTACTDDGTSCTSDLCQAGTCVHAPVLATSCRQSLPKASTLSLKDTDPARPTLVWKWRKGDATTLADFGDPFYDGDSDYELCAFDRSGPGGTYALAFNVHAPAGGTCGKRPCWQTKGVKIRYHDHDRTPDGADTLELVPGPNDGAKVTFTAKGPNLALPAGALSPDVRLQLRRDDDVACWEAKFQSRIQTNAPGLFKAKND
jgi:photosystem II stability/assembly factor-like uncharacterized protein